MRYFKWEPDFFDKRVWYFVEHCNELGNTYHLIRAELRPKNAD